MSNSKLLIRIDSSSRSVVGSFLLFFPSLFSYIYFWCKHLPTMGPPTYFLDLETVLFAYQRLLLRTQEGPFSALLLLLFLSCLSIIADILVFVLSFAWTMFSTISINLKNNVFVVVFPDKAALNQIASTIALIFVSDLLQVLQSTVPFTIEYFKTLLSCNRLDRFWAVYLLILEKSDYKLKIYVDSDTETKLRVWNRLQCYIRENMLSKFVKKALDDSYYISYKSLLCRCSIPARCLQPTIRTLFILLEAGFTFVFCAMYATKGDYGMFSICSWDRASLEYSGLCSYCCLSELVLGDWGFSNKELAILANLRKAKKRKRDQNRVDRFRTAKKHWCDFCKVSSASKYRLDQHNATPSHLRRAADMVDSKKSYKCVSCNISFNYTGVLYRHQKSVKHKATVSNILRRKF